MTTLLATFPPVDCNSPALVPCPSDVAPAECEPTGPAPADAAWWASQQTGGCGPDDLSPEDRLIASAMTAMEWHLQQAGLRGY